MKAGNKAIKNGATASAGTEKIPVYSVNKAKVGRDAGTLASRPDFKLCPICHGKGQIREDAAEYDFFTRDPESKLCLHCMGKGRVEVVQRGITGNFHKRDTEKTFSLQRDGDDAKSRLKPAELPAEASGTMQASGTFTVPVGTRQKVVDLLKYAVGGSAARRRDVMDKILAILEEARCR